MAIGEADVREKTRNFIVTNFFLDTSVIKVDDRTSFLETGIIDSTGILEVVTYLQETFGITIEDHEMLPVNLDSLNNIGAFVCRKLESASADAVAVSSS